MRRVVVLLAFGLVGMGILPVQAQDVKMERTPFERELGSFRRPPSLRAAGPRMPTTIRTPGASSTSPHFFEALSAKTETGRFGFAGWSSPNSPAGPDYSEINGWLSFGFAFTWSSPPVTRGSGRLTADRRHGAATRAVRI